MSDVQYKYLADGIDTIEISYYLRADANSLIDFEALAAKRENLCSKKTRVGTPIKLGTEEFLLQGNGTKRGYPFLMENECFQVEFGEFNKPNFFVTYRSKALWHNGLEVLNAQFLFWAQSVGFTPYQPETISRVDYAFDYLIPDMSFDEDHFYTVAATDKRYRKRRKVQTMYFGSGSVLLRIYNKSAEVDSKGDKVWFYPIWGGVTDDVWRVEWQFRTDRLKQIGIRSLKDLRERQGDLLRNHITNHTSLRIKGVGVDIKDSPTHPLWKDYLSRIEEMPAIGIVRECDEEKVSEERMLRMLISVLGYMKRVAAIQCVKKDLDHMSLNETLLFLRTRLLSLCAPLRLESRC